MSGFNNHLRQIILLAIIIFIGILMLTHFYIFIPGVLGAVTLYILSRKTYDKLIEKNKWKPGWTALLYIIGFIIIICLPVYIAVVLVTPKLVALFNNPVQLTIALKSFSQRIFEATGVELYNGDSLKTATQKLANNIPMLLTGTANFLTNLLLMFFVLYYMLVHGVAMEKYLHDFIPLKETNRNILSSETNIMIRANAIGIPLLAIIQGLVGTLGFWIFGVSDFAIWGFLTGVASLIPIVGTGLIWVPLTIYLLAINQVWQGVGLAIYSLVILTNIDYVARITVLRRIGNVHPLITILGVIIGLSMFGFLGLVFGPLLISYFIILIRIYRNEFHSEPITPFACRKRKISYFVRSHSMLLPVCCLSVAIPLFCKLPPHMELYIKNLCCILILLFSFSKTSIAQPKYEFRGVWVATVDNIDFPTTKYLSTDEQKAEFISLLEMHRRNGMNAVVVQIRPAADAFYPSQYEPWSEWLTGTQGKPPSAVL